MVFFMIRSRMLDGSNFSRLMDVSPKVREAGCTSTPLPNSNFYFASSYYTFLLIVNSIDEEFLQAFRGWRKNLLVIDSITDLLILVTGFWSIQLNEGIIKSLLVI